MLSSHSEGRGLVLSAVLCTKFFISPGLAKLDSLLCMERQSSSTFCGKSSGMDVPEELCHQFPAPLTALVRPFNFWTILCLIYLDDLLWGIFSQTKDEPGAMNCFVSLLRAAFNETMQQKRAGFENLWQMAKGQIFFVGFFFFPSNMSLISGFEGESEGSSRVESWGDNREILLCHHVQYGHSSLGGWRVVEVNEQNVFGEGEDIDFWIS